MRQEQKPGRVSDWARASSAGLRTFWSPLKEFPMSVYIVGKSEAESAIAYSQPESKQKIQMPINNERFTGNAISIAEFNRWWGEVDEVEEFGGFSGDFIILGFYLFGLVKSSSEMRKHHGRILMLRTRGVRAQTNWPGFSRHFFFIRPSIRGQ